MSGSLGSQNNPLFVRMGDDSWAKDSTLQKILQSLPAKWKKAADDSKQQTAAANTNTGALNNNTAAQKSLPYEIKQKLGNIGYEWKTILTQGFSQGGGIFGSLGTTFKNLNLTTENSTKSQKLLGLAAEDLGKTFVFVGLAVNKLIEVDKVFTEVFDTGVRLQGGINGLITESNKAGLSFQTFGSVAAKNSQAFAVFGGQNLPNLTKMFLESTRSGGDFIMGLQDSVEVFYQTADLYQKAGVAGSMSNEQLVKSSKNLIGEITKTSEVTGQSRKSLLEFVGSLNKTGSSYLLLSTMSDKARENFVNSSVQLAKFGQTGGKLLYDNIQKYVAGGRTFGLLDDSMIKLFGSVSGLGDNFAKLAEGMEKGGEDAERATKDFASFLSSVPTHVRENILRGMPEISGALGDLIQNADAVAKAEKTKLEEMETESKRRGVSLEQVKEERKKQEEADKQRTQALNDLTKSLNNLNNEIFRAFASFGNFLTPAIKIFAESLEGLVGLFQKIDGLATGGSGGLLGPILAGTGLVASTMLVRRLGGTLLRRFRGRPTSAPATPGQGESPLIPGMVRGNTPTTPLFVSVVGSAGGLAGALSSSGAPGTPGAGGRTGGRFGRLAGMLGRGSIGGLIAGAALGGVGSLATGAGYTKTGAGIDILGQAAGLAGTGAMLGSFLGPPGTLIGGALGGLAGAGMGLYQNWGTLFGQQGGAAERSPEQAAGQLSFLEQIDQMLENRQGLNLQYTETGQALRDFSGGYREMISALSLSPAGGLDTARGLLNLVTPQAPAAVAPAYQAANDWQMEVLPIWKSIRDHNEVMVSLLRRIAGDIDSLGTPPVQASGMLPG